MMNLPEKYAYMATGQPYNDLDPLLIQRRDRATRLTDELNATADPDAKATLFTALVGSAGPRPVVNPNFRCEFGDNIHVGRDFYANYDVVMLDGAPITIGDAVLFGPKVGLYTSNHLIDPTERAQGGCIAKPITIGDQCWLAANVTVLPGVTIGAGTVIQVLRPITAADRTGFAGQDLI